MIFQVTVLRCFVVDEADADVSKLGVHWWIALLIALVAMLLISLIIFIICFVTCTRRSRRLHIPAGNNLVLVCRVIVVDRVGDSTLPLLASP